MPRCARVLLYIALALTTIAIVAEVLLSDLAMVALLATLGFLGCAALYIGLCHANKAIRQQSLSDFITIAVTSDDPSNGR
jgi:hypothetical protein